MMGTAPFGSCRRNERLRRKFAHVGVHYVSAILAISRQILSRCEWGRDDYSLRVENLPSAPPQPGQQGFDFGQEDS